MKALITSILTIILLNINLLYSQTWPKYYGLLNRPDNPKDIIEMYDNGYLILGEFFNSTYTKRWGWLIKTDINGITLWEKVFEHPQEWVNLRAIEQTPDGGLVICGSVGVSSGIFYPLVLKLNACGEKEWCKLFGGSPNSLAAAMDVKVDVDGNIVLLLLQYGSIPHESIHLAKLTADGEVLWIEPFATVYNHPGSWMKVPNYLTITSDNKYLISGDADWVHPWGSGSIVYVRPLFIMANSDGNEEWVLPFGLNDTIIGGDAFNVIPHGIDSYISVGGRMSSGGLYKGLIMSFDNTGNELGFSNLSFDVLSPEFNTGGIIYISEIDTMFILASLFGNSSWSPSVRPGEMLMEDIDFDSLSIVDYTYYFSNRYPYALKSVSSGKYLSTSAYPHSSNNYDIFLAKLNLNLEYDTAYTTNYTYDSLCFPGPPQSGFIYLDECDIITSIEMPSAAQYRAKISSIPINIYPNPAQDHITFALENTVHHRNIELRCFNMLGLLQHKTIILPGQEQATTNVSAWPPGMYIAVAYSDGKPVGRGKFVVQR
jgi:hypothetical protein